MKSQVLHTVCCYILVRLQGKLITVGSQRVTRFDPYSPYSGYKEGTQNLGLSFWAFPASGRKDEGGSWQNN